jgi:hypothetical protein
MFASAQFGGGTAAFHNASRVLDFSFELATIWKDVFGGEFLSEEYWRLFTCWMHRGQRDWMTLKQLHRDMYRSLDITRKRAKGFVATASQAGLCEVQELESAYLVMPTSAFFEKAASYTSRAAKSLVSTHNEAAHNALSVDTSQNLTYIPDLLRFFEDYSQHWNFAIAKILGGYTTQSFLVDEQAARISTMSCWYILMRIWREQTKMMLGERDSGYRIHREEIRWFLWARLGSVNGTADSRLRVLVDLGLIEARPTTKNEKKFYLLSLECHEEILKMLLRVHDSLHDTARRMSKSATASAGSKIIPINYGRDWPVAGAS